MIEEKKNFGWESFVWRGALGGVIGNLVVLGFGVARLTDGVSQVLMIGGILAAAAGVIAGSALGYIIWKASCKWNKSLSPILRVVLGVSCFLAYSLLTDLTKINRPPLVFTVGYAVVVGGLAGLLSRGEYSVVTGISDSDRA